MKQVHWWKFHLLAHIAIRCYSITALVDTNLDTVLTTGLVEVNTSKQRWPADDLESIKGLYVER